MQCGICRCCNRAGPAAPKHAAPLCTLVKDAVRLVCIMSEMSPTHLMASAALIGGEGEPVSEPWKCRLSRAGVARPYGKRSALIQH